MVWTPSIRPAWQFDFEDRFEDEEYGSLLTEPRTPFDLKDDQESRDYFMDRAHHHGPHGGDLDPGQEDRFLRKAAQRGDATAMAVLMDNRYTIEHDSEALRWARRVLSGKFSWGGRDSAEIEFWLSGVQKVANWAVENNIGTTTGRVSLTSDGSDDPNDISTIFKEFNCFCLICGKLKLANADPTQCDDSVHIVLHNFGR